MRKQILYVSIVERGKPANLFTTWKQHGRWAWQHRNHIRQWRGSTNDSTDEIDVHKLRRKLEKVTPDGIRHRQLSMLLKNAEIPQRNATRTHRDDCLGGRRLFLVNSTFDSCGKELYKWIIIIILVKLGVASKLRINRCVIDRDEPLPLALEQMEWWVIEKREQRIQAQRKQQEKKQAREAFTNPWLIGMETGMAECNRQLEGTEDAKMQAVLTSMLEINSNKLCLFHKNQGTLALGRQEAPTERKLGTKQS